MVKIRLTRTGRKNHATFRVVAVDSRKKRDTKAIEELGYYLPHTKEFKVDQARIEYWMSVGAQPTDTVARKLVKAGILTEEYLPNKAYTVEPGDKSKERTAAKVDKKEAAKQAKADAKEAAKAAKEEAKAEVTEGEKEEAVKDKPEEVTKETTSEEPKEEKKEESEEPKEEKESK